MPVSSANGTSLARSSYAEYLIIRYDIICLLLLEFKCWAPPMLTMCIASKILLCTVPVSPFCKSYAEQLRADDVHCSNCCLGS
jgi:hypothetical protein